MGEPAEQSPTSTRWQKVRQFGGRALSAGIGAVLAVMADLIQKENASAVVKVSSVTSEHLSLTAPPFVWALVLIALGISLCLVFEPKTKARAFYLGASVVALVMTAVPYSPPPSAPPPLTAGQMNPLLPNHNFFLANAHAQILKTESREDTVELEIRAIDLAEKQTREEVIEVLLSVYDTTNEEKWQFNLSVPSGDISKKSWVLPASSQERTFLVRAEAEGYKVFTSEHSVPGGATLVSVPVLLIPTVVPLWVDKMFRIYKF